MPFADLHCDTIHRLRYGGLKGDLKKNTGQIDLDRLFGNHYSLQVFAAFVELSLTKDPLESCLTLLEDLRRETAGMEKSISLIRNAADLKTDKLNVVFSVEEGGVIGESEEALDLLYDKGVRAVTLTWNFPNSLGFPNHEFKDSDKGLTAFGKKMAEKMGHLGIALDVSHLSDKGFDDVADISKKPFMASHSGAREVFSHSRNLTDQQIKRIADSGGIIGLILMPTFLDGSMEMTVEKWMRHLMHVYRVGGEEVLAFGSDFDGMEGAFEVDGVQDVHLLDKAMREAGLSNRVIEKFAGKNALRFFQDVL